MEQTWRRWRLKLRRAMNKLDLPTHWKPVRFLLRKLGILEHNKIENYTFTRNLPVTVLELGSRTSKFTLVMVEILGGTGTQIIASDPTGTMIQQFQRVLPRIEILQCRAENIGKSGLIHFCLTL